MNTTELNTTEPCNRWEAPVAEVMPVSETATGNTNAGGDTITGLTS